MKNRLSISLAFAVALLLAMNAAQAAQNADVTGEWLMTITTPNGERVMTLNLMQDGTSITGTAEAEGQEEPIEVTGTIEGNNITLNLALGGRGGGGRGGGGGGRGGGRGAGWEGVVDGDTMSGERSMGNRGTLTWMAKKQ